MRKIFTLILILGASLTAAQAQNSVKKTGFFDNWSLSLVGGAITPTTHHAFWGSMRATYGLELNKQITPVVATSLQYTAANNVSASRTIIDATNLTLFGKLNLSNLFVGYNGKPRVFELEAAVGVGWGHDFVNASYGTDENYLTTKYGLNFNFNLGSAKAWTISLRPSIVYNLDRATSYCANAYDVNKSAIELLAGVTYHFKNANNGKHYMTFVREYDQAEVDALNAKINDLRAQVSDKDAEIANQNDQIRQLQEELDECRNAEPRVDTIAVTNTTASLEQTVTFRQGKSTVDSSQLPNVERVATFLKNHSDATVSIKGYASPEGSIEINEKLAKARAEAVKTILINKYGISSSRISAEGLGVGDMFSEPDWNRVSICTIIEAE